MLARQLSALRSARAFSSAARLEVQQAPRLDALGTRRIFDEEHDMLREAARNWWNSAVVPHHNKWEDAGEVPRELWLEAGAQGLLCMTMPEETGGAGGNVLHATVGWEEQSYAMCSGPGFSLHSEIVAPYILNYGSDAQKEQYLPAMARGETIGAIAMTEPGAGSDLLGTTTVAKAQADGDYVLNGSKTYITNGGHSDVVIVVAKGGSGRDARGVSLFLVDTSLAGFSKGKNLKKLGLRAQDTCELFFDDVRLPASSLLGEAGHGFKYLMTELPQERLLIASMAVAAAEAVFERTREWLHDRSAFGSKLVEMQLLRHRMAQLKTDIAVGRAFVDSCLELHAAGRLDTATASMAKAAATELQCSVADACVGLHGGAGFIWDTAACRAFADARVQPIYGGTNDIMRDLIARTL